MYLFKTVQKVVSFENYILNCLGNWSDLRFINLTVNFSNCQCGFYDLTINVHGESFCLLKPLKKVCEEHIYWVFGEITVVSH